MCIRDRYYNYRQGGFPMNHVTALYHALEKEEKLHHDDIYNYAIPNAPI